MAVDVSCLSVVNQWR